MTPKMKKNQTTHKTSKPSKIAIFPSCYCIKPKLKRNSCNLPKKPNQAPDFSHSFMHTKVGAWRRYKSEIIYYNPSTSYAASTSF